MSSNAFFRIVKCPACESDSVYSPQNPYRPFCSERCKNHDLGAWANEEHRVSQAPSTEDLIDDVLDLDLPPPSPRPPRSTLQ